MPEGDTIHKPPRRLRPALEGKAIQTLCLRDRGDVPEFAGVAIALVGVGFEGVQDAGRLLFDQPEFDLLEPAIAVVLSSADQLASTR